MAPLPPHLSDGKLRPQPHAWDFSHLKLNTLDATRDLRPRRGQGQRKKKENKDGSRSRQGTLRRKGQGGTKEGDKRCVNRILKGKSRAVGTVPSSGPGPSHGHRLPSHPLKGPLPLCLAGQAPLSISKDCRTVVCLVFSVYTRLPVPSHTTTQPCLAWSWLCTCARHSSHLGYPSPSSWPVKSHRCFQAQHPHLLRQRRSDPSPNNEPSPPATRVLGAHSACNVCLSGECVIS